MSSREQKLFKRPEGVAGEGGSDGTVESQVLPDISWQESPVETKESTGDPFVEAQKELAAIASCHLEEMRAMVENTAYADAKLKIDAADISGENGVAMQQRIKKLNERAENLFDIYSAKIMAFTRAAILAAVPVVLLANGSDAPPDLNRVAQIEQSQGVAPDFPRVVARASAELQKSGITTEQKAGYIPGINDMLHKGIDSHSYREYWNKTKDFLPNVLLGRKEYKNEMEDAYRMYLGIPQEHKTFAISDYRPAQSTEQKYYYKIDAFFEKLIVRQYGDDGQKMIRDVLSRIEAGERFNDDGVDMVMGRYKMGKGADENGPYISYYDRWDLDAIPIEGTSGFFGKPYEIYDRIYYDADSLAPSYDKDIADQLKEKQLQNYKKSA